MTVRFQTIATCATLREPRAGRLPPLSRSTAAPRLSRWRVGLFLLPFAHYLSVRATGDRLPSKRPRHTLRVFPRRAIRATSWRPSLSSQLGEGLLFGRPDQVTPSGESDSLKFAGDRKLPTSGVLSRQVASPATLSSAAGLVVAEAGDIEVWWTRRTRKAPSRQKLSATSRSRIPAADASAICA